MKKENYSKTSIYGVFVASIFSTSQAVAMGGDDPWLSMVRFHELQYLQEDGNDVIEWDADAWIGRDLSKFWLKTEGEYVDSDEQSGIESGNVELLYSRVFSPYWAWQAGVRHDFKPEVDGDTRNWVSFGFMGTAYNFWELDTSLFVGEESSIQLRFEYEREYMLTQKWVLTPDMELIFNGDNNEKYGEGSGLSEAEFSLRLGYEPNRQFQPYIGLTATQTIGNTRDFAKAEGEKSGNLSATIGLHFWF